MRFTRPTWILSAIPLVAASTAACGDDGRQSDDQPAAADEDDDDGGDQPMRFEPSAETSRIIDDIESYRQWGTFAKNSEVTRSSGHAPGGNPMYVLTYRNDIVAGAEAEGMLPLPDGSLIVKENYPTADAAEPMALTVMAKSDGGWFWVQLTADGKVMADSTGAPLQGADLPMCMECHAVAEDTDYVYLLDPGAATDAGAGR